MSAFRKHVYLIYLFLVAGGVGPITSVGKIEFRED
jgi:hypothetical protein